MIRLFFLILILYFYIFNPIFLAIGIGASKFILLPVMVYVVLRPSLLKGLALFKTEVYFVMLLIIYSFLNSFRTGVGLFVMQYQYILWFIESIFVPIILIKWFSKDIYKFGINSILVFVGSFAALVTIFLILNPEINDFVRNSLISYSSHDNERYELVRGFGIAENLLGSYAMTLGMILAICLMLLAQNIWFVIPVIPVIVSIAFNARTGLISIPVAFILLFATGKFTFKLFAVVTLFLLFLTNIFTTQNSFFDNHAETINWWIEGIDDISDNLGGDFSVGATGTLLLDEKFDYDKVSVLEFLFGVAQFGPNNSRVDNGYYYILWFGGVFFLLLFLLYLSYMFYHLYKLDTNRYMPWMLFLLLLFFQIKWNYFFVPSGIFRLVGLYYVYTCKKAYGFRNSSLMLH